MLGRRNLGPLKLLEAARQTICLVGDGGFHMTGNEFSVAVERKLPIKVFVSDNRSLGTIRPRRDVHHAADNQPVTVPAVRHALLEDLYVILGVVDEETRRITVKALVIPAVGLLWSGMAVMVAGTAIAAWPDRRERRAMAPVTGPDPGPDRPGLAHAGEP